MKGIRWSFRRGMIMMDGSCDFVMLFGLFVSEVRLAVTCRRVKWPLSLVISRNFPMGRLIRRILFANHPTEAVMMHSAVKVR